MCRIVLPLVAAVNAVATLNVVDPIATANVRIAIEVVIVVDVYVGATPAGPPAPAAAPRSAHRQSNAE